MKKFDLDGDGKGFKEGFLAAERSGMKKGFELQSYILHRKK